MCQESVIGLAGSLWLMVSHGGSQAASWSCSHLKVQPGGDLLPRSLTWWLTGLISLLAIDWKPHSLTMWGSLCTAHVFSCPIVSDLRKRLPKTEAVVLYNLIASEVMYLHFCHILLVTRLTSYCCYNKLPQTWWLSATQIYYFPVLETRSLKWVSRTAFLLKAQGEDPFPSFSSF